MTPRSGQTQSQVRVITWPTQKSTRLVPAGPLHESHKPAWLPPGSRSRYQPRLSLAASSRHRRAGAWRIPRQPCLPHKLPTGKSWPLSLGEVPGGGALAWRSICGALAVLKFQVACRGRGFPLPSAGASHLRLVSVHPRCWRMYKPRPRRPLLRLGHWHSVVSPCATGSATSSVDP